MVFYSAFHSLSDNLYHSIYFFFPLHLELTFQSIMDSDSQMFSSPDAAEKHKNIIAFVFLVTQHAIRTAEELLKLSLEDVYFAIKHNFYDNHDKTVA